MAENHQAELKSLVIAEENVRKDCPPDDEVDALAELIAAEGLQKPLNVYRKGKTQFAVYDGRRRLFALRRLAKANRLPPDCADGVPVRIGTKEQARQASLSAGLGHRSFHPAEEYRQFRKLIEDGKTVEDIAKAYSMSEADVAKRLKLARVAPEIFDAFARDELTLEQVMAFALIDDHDRQMRIFADNGMRLSARQIRAALTRDDVPATDKRARFIGAEAYEAAGGKITRDLFEESPDLFGDAGLLDALVEAQLKEAAVAVKAEGWAWVETMTDFDDCFHRTYFRVHPEMQEKSEDDAREHERLSERYDAILDGAEYEEDLSDEDLAELRRIDEALEALDARYRKFSDEDIKRGGAVICLEHSGALVVMRGLVERKKEKSPKKASSAIPHSAHRRLTEIATQALARDIASNGEVADIVLTAALAHGVFGYGGASGVKISVSGLRVSDDNVLPVPPELAARQERCAAMVGADLGETIKAVAALEADARADLKAISVAASLDFSEARSDQRDERARAVASVIGAMTGTDIRRHWTPDAEYFGKLNTKALLAALDDMGKDARSLAGAKRKELAAIAVREAAVRDWTPEPARFVEGGKPESPAAADAA